ncbi:MAG TPA: PAS domain-containing sensor histidine kinase [Patescibacteria group bacterium]|nr:PAS domain-containing sensor histidine kinase [Patescibacteria group bacterium]
MDSPFTSHLTRISFSEPTGVDEYSVLFENHPNPLFIYSLSDFKILQANRSAIEQYGYSSEELLMMTMLDIRPEEDREMFIRFMADPSAVEAPDSWRHQRKNGDIMYVKISSQPILWNGTAARIFSVNDVTEHKRTELRLRESEKLYRHVIENAGDFIYTTDINGYFRDVNDSALKVCGYTLDELQGYRYIDLIAPAYRKNIMMRYMRQFLKREKSLHVEFPFVVKSGGIKWFSQYSTLIFKDGKPHGFHIIGHDITSRKIAEEELNKANVALEKRVADRTTELEKALERLEHALEKEKELGELKSRFVTMISHEFRTPLTSILSGVELLQRYSQHLTEDKREAMFRTIIESVHHMTHLLEDVLEFGKSHNPAQISFQPESSDITAVFKDIVRLAQSSNTSRVITLSLNGDYPKVNFDRKLLRIIITAILSNALKYSAKTTPVDIDVSLLPDMLRFSITDAGTGIPPQDIPHLFDPFYRGKKAETIAGTGLGLTMVKQSVERHGGSISVESEVGKGSTFTVVIPLHSAF